MPHAGLGALHVAELHAPSLPVRDRVAVLLPLDLLDTLVEAIAHDGDAADDEHHAGQDDAEEDLDDGAVEEPVLTRT